MPDTCGETNRLGLVPNIYFDTASLPAYVAEEGYPFPTAGQYIREVISYIGASKVMWGTDIPALLSVATYRQLLGAAHAHLSSLEDSVQVQVLGENALKVFSRSRRWAPTAVTKLELTNMTNRIDRLEISRRSILGFLGAGAAERALARHPLLSTMKSDATEGFITRRPRPGELPTIAIDSTHQVNYFSGGLSYVENFHQGHWVGSSLSAGGKPQELSEPETQDAFTSFVKDKPDSSQERGTPLSGDWQWVSASEARPQGEQKRHGLVKLSNSKLPLTLEIHTLLDGTPIFTRWLTLTNESRAPWL